MRDQKTRAIAPFRTGLGHLTKIEALPLVPHECQGDGFKGFVRPAPPLPNHLVERYWRMRRARPWMSEAEILRRLRDPEID
jgi:hypothetical protein